MPHFPRLRSQVLIPLFFAVFCSLLCGQSNKDDPSENIPGLHNTFWVTCGDQPPYKEHTATSPVLISPNGQYSAFARVTASEKCQNTSTLFIRGAKSSTYRQVFSEKPSEGQLGNGMKIVDWSPDSHLLLVEVVLWQYGSDADWNHKILLYDVSQDRFVQPDFDATLEGTPNDCWTDVRALGFSADKQVVIKTRVQPYYDPGDDEPRNAQCPTMTGLWLVALDGGMQYVGNDIEIKRYGTASPKIKK